ncbi:MAG: hypothetical protein AB8F78_04810 [Saprospiraceae bacterium]
MSTYRPDLIWAIGQDHSITPCFGMNQIRFDGGTVEVFDLDSIGVQSFGFSSVQFNQPEFSLYGNSIRLTRGFSDFILSHLSYDTWNFRRDPSTTTGFGFQAILPLGEDKLLYVSETIYESDGSTPYLFYTPGFVVSYLYTDSLADSSPNQNSVIETKFIHTNDTLSDFLAEHISNPLGGWYGISKSSMTTNLPMWQIESDTTFMLPPQQAFNVGDYREGSVLDITFRPAGDVFAISGEQGGIDLFRFDRLTGIVEPWVEISNAHDPDFEPFTVATRCEWSADGRYLYVTTEANLFQFDTEAADIEASAVQINDPDNIPFRGTYYQIERGPDCRLYVARSGTGKTLSVIDKPSRPGRACELKDSGLLLPNYYFVSIPEFPEYSLWAKDRVARGLAPIIDTAVCDSSIQAYDYFDWTTSTTEVLVEAEQLVISPNPARSGSVITLKYDLPASLLSEFNAPLSASLFSIDGKQVGNLEILSIGEEAASVQLPTNVPKGLYRLLITNATRPLLEGKVLVQ